MKQKNLMSDWNWAQRAEKFLDNYIMDVIKTWEPREIHAYLVIEVIKFMNFRKDRTLFLHDGLLI